MKRMTAVTIDEQTLRDAKESGVNISRAAEEGIMRRTNRQEITDSHEYDLELAVTDEENFWINPKNNKCEMRPEPQFLISKNGSIYPVSKAEYMKWKNYHCKKTEEKKAKTPKKGQIYMGPLE